MATILLVEDNEMNRDMLSRRLERRGHKILIAIDGEEGLAKTESELPDIVLMDMSLPKIDGWETTRRIKQNPKTANIPIIALTAYAMKSDEDRAREAGCNDFDTKPVDLNRLLEKINRQLTPSKGGT
jgi:two-component system cell cycle response regulator DivK